MTFTVTDRALERLVLQMLSAFGDSVFWPHQALHRTGIALFAMLTRRVANSSTAFPNRYRDLLSFGTEYRKCSAFSIIFEALPLPDSYISKSSI